MLHRTGNCPPCANLARFEPPPSSGRGNFNAAASWIDPKSLPRLWTPEQGMRRKRFRDNPIQAMWVKKGGKGRPATRRFLTRRKSRKQRPSIDGAAGPSSRRVVREGKAMIHSSRRDRKAKAIAEVLAMIANAEAPLAPHRPRPVLEADERLFETAAEFCAALEKYAECATKIERVNH